MHVAVVIRKFARTGGVERYAAALMRRLLRRGHRVTLVCARADLPPPDGVAVIRAGRLGLGETMKNMVFARAAASATAPGRFDASISLSRAFGQDVMRAGHGTHEGYLRAMAAAGAGASRGRLDRVLHGIEARQLADPGLKTAIAISRRVKDELTAIHGVDPAKIAVVHNGVDLARFGKADRGVARSALGLDTGAFVVAYVGGGFARKGLRYLIEAIPLMKAGRAPVLIVAGGDPRQAEYEALARKAGADVRFFGSREDVETFYAAADAAALPTLYEPFGSAVLEAMASGVPVAVSRAAGASEIYPADLAHLVLDEPRDPQAVAAALERYADPGARARDGARCRKVAEAHPIEGALDRAIEILESVPGRSTPPAGGGRR